MGQANFAQAATELQLAAASEDDGTYRTLERLERIILDHKPHTPDEAVAMLDVIIPDVSAGGRSDGRDVKALCSIRSMLTGI
ncbi:hypothetical protein [Brevundimonas sp.]|uniref:hypothetical protein n=1 Tax=Brevundimonas sp. TaxID=1871086 RepID=UPI003D14B771